MIIAKTLEGGIGCFSLVFLSLIFFFLDNLFLRFLHLDILFSTIRRYHLHTRNTYDNHMLTTRIRSPLHVTTLLECRFLLAMKMKRLKYPSCWEVF